MSRPGFLVIGAVVTLTLIATSRTRIVGDGAEYLAEATNFSFGRGPAIGRRDIPEIQRALARTDPALGSWDIAANAVRSPGGRYDFVHFWFYALLAAPGVFLARTVGAPPLAAFTALNLVLFGIALWVVVPRLGPAASVLLFASPVVWWIDKAHTEMFTVALLTISLALIDDAPWWSLVAAAAASTQNPPIAAVSLAAGLFSAIARPSLLHDRRFVIGAIAALGLMLLAPVYTYWRHDTVSLLIPTTRAGIPDAQELLAPVLDPDIGLVGNFPIWLLMVGVGIVLTARMEPRRLLSPGAATAWIAAAVFLASCGRTMNLHHGGTPSLSRYALWLVPLAIPLFSGLRVRGGHPWRVSLAAAAIVSAPVSLVAFHPGVAEHQREPTWLADWLWTRHPGWNNPLPEVFAETELQSESIVLPVSTPNCAKILLPAVSSDQPTWPISCDPAPVPDRCRQAGRLCYANLDGPDHYVFAAAPGRWPGRVPVPADRAWNPASEPVIRSLYDAWKWSLLPCVGNVDALRQARDVHVFSCGTSDRFVLVLEPSGPQPVLTLRFAGPVTGELVDAGTGRVLDRPAFAGSAVDPWILPLPADVTRLVLLISRG